MMSFKSKRKFSRMALAATVGLAVVIGCAASGARAADNDEDDALLDTKIVRGILKGLGLKKDEGDQIDYRERSPLVLPPANEARQLPPPANDANARKTVAWPDDPDVKRVKARKSAERNRKAYVEGVDDRPLMPSEVNGNAPRVKPENASSIETDETSRPLPPAELGSKSIFSKNVFSNLWGSKEETATFTGEPPRSSLVDPPSGYRTPSPTQPFGVGIAKDTYKPIDRQEPVK